MEEGARTLDMAAALGASGHLLGAVVARIHFRLVGHRTSIMPAPIFILTGPPGAGKSSVATVLMRRFPFALHIPLDDLREWVVSGLAYPIPEWTEETGRQFELARHSAADMARRYATAGFAVAIDDVITPDEAKRLFVDPLAGFPVHRVLLRPALDIALQRNANRDAKDFDSAVLHQPIQEIDRWIGERDWDGWIAIDNGTQTIEETADEILRRTRP
jgi:chloramphenicol 3-O-phosphotransferase